MSSTPTSPLSPLSPSAPEALYTVTAAHAPRHEGEIKLRPNDVITNVKDLGNGWSLGQNITRDRLGIFPTHCIAALRSEGAERELPNEVTRNGEEEKGREVDGEAESGESQSKHSIPKQPAPKGNKKPNNSSTPNSSPTSPSPKELSSNSSRILCDVTHLDTPTSRVHSPDDETSPKRVTSRPPIFFKSSPNKDEKGGVGEARKGERGSPAQSNYPPMSGVSEGGGGSAGGRAGGGSGGSGSGRGALDQPLYYLHSPNSPNAEEERHRKQTAISQQAILCQQTGPTLREPHCQIQCGNQQKPTRTKADQQNSYNQEQNGQHLQQLDKRRGPKKRAESRRVNEAEKRAPDRSFLSKREGMRDRLNGRRNKSPNQNMSVTTRHQGNEDTIDDVTLMPPPPPPPVPPLQVTGSAQSVAGESRGGIVSGGGGGSHLSTFKPGPVPATQAGRTPGDETQQRGDPGREIQSCQGGRNLQSDTGQEYRRDNIAELQQNSAAAGQYRRDNNIANTSINSGGCRQYEDSEYDGDLESRGEAIRVPSGGCFENNSEIEDSLQEEEGEEGGEGLYGTDSLPTQKRKNRGGGGKPRLAVKPTNLSMEYPGGVEEEEECTQGRVGRGGVTVSSRLPPSPRQQGGGGDSPHHATIRTRPPSPQVPRRTTSIQPAPTPDPRQRPHNLPITSSLNRGGGGDSSSDMTRSCPSDYAATCLSLRGSQERSLRGSQERMLDRQQRSSQDRLADSCGEGGPSRPPGILRSVRDSSHSIPDYERGAAGSCGDGYYDNNHDEVDNYTNEYRANQNHSDSPRKNGGRFPYDEDNVSGEFYGDYRTHSKPGAMRGSPNKSVRFQHSSGSLYSSKPGLSKQYKVGDCQNQAIYSSPLEEAGVPPPNRARRGGGGGGRGGSTVGRILGAVVTGLAVGALTGVWMRAHAGWGLGVAVGGGVGVGVGLCLALAVSRLCRCVAALLLPSVATTRGRLAALLVVTGMLVAGPLSTTFRNAREVSRSLGCSADQVYNQSQQLLAPFDTMMLQLGGTLQQLQLAASDVSTGLQPLHAGLQLTGDQLANGRVQLDWTSRACREMVSRAFNECTVGITHARDNCNSAIAKLGTVYLQTQEFLEQTNLGRFAPDHVREQHLFKRQTLLAGAASGTDEEGDGNICEPLNQTRVCQKLNDSAAMCLPATWAGEAIQEAINKTQSALNRLRYELQFQIDPDLYQTARANASMSVYRVRTHLLQEFDSRSRHLELAISIVTKLLPLSLLLLVYVAYLHVKYYVSRDAYDNHYVNKYFAELDRKRTEVTGCSVLPLRRCERLQLVDTQHADLSPREEPLYSAGLCVLLLHTLLTLAAFLADFLLYATLRAIRSYAQPPGTADVTGQAALDDVLGGSGALAELLRLFLHGFHRAKQYGFEEGENSCLPRPEPPRFSYLVAVSMLYVFIILTILLKAYLFRLRNCITSAFYPERAKVRAAFLYNALCAQRAHAPLRLHAQVRYNFRSLKQQQNISALHRAASRCPGAPCCRLLVDAPQRCLLCGASEEATSHDCDTEGCDGLYCASCYADLRHICPLCLQGAHYDKNDRLLGQNQPISGGYLGQNKPINGERKSERRNGQTKTAFYIEAEEEDVGDTFHSEGILEHDLGLGTLHDVSSNDRDLQQYSRHNQIYL